MGPSILHRLVIVVRRGTLYLFFTGTVALKRTDEPDYRYRAVGNRGGMKGRSLPLGILKMELLYASTLVTRSVVLAPPRRKEIKGNIKRSCFSLRSVFLLCLSILLSLSVVLLLRLVGFLSS